MVQFSDRLATIESGILLMHKDIEAIAVPKKAVSESKEEPPVTYKDLGQMGGKITSALETAVRKVHEMVFDEAKNSKAELAEFASRLSHL